MRSTMSDLAEDSHSDTSSLDRVHPILSESDLSRGGVRSDSFTGVPGSPSQTAGGRLGSNGRRASGRRKSGKKSTQSGDLEGDATSVSSEYSNRVSLGSSVCSSPDSNGHDDTHVSTGAVRTVSGKGGLYFRIIPTYDGSSPNS